MTTIPCHEPRCTTKIDPSKAHVELRWADEPAAHFCSVACVESWLRRRTMHGH
jgi:hypothetical protein